MREKLLTVEEAAEFLNVQPYQVRRYIKSGELKAHRIGGTLGNKPDRRGLRIYESDLLAYVNNNEVKSNEPDSSESG